jgi:hypothetical protein
VVPPLLEALDRRGLGDDQLGEAPPAQHEVDHLGERVPGPLEAGRLLPDPVEDLLQVRHQRVGERAEDVVLGLVVVVEGRLAEPEPLGDLAQRRPVVALLDEEVEGDVEDATTSFP